MNLLTAAPCMGGCLLSTAYGLHFIDRVMQISTDPETSNDFDHALQLN